MFESRALKKKEGEGFYISTTALKVIGLVCAVVGTFSISVVQNNWMDIGSYTSETLLTAMETDPQIMKLSTAAVLLNAVYNVGLPLFSYLLVEGFFHTSDVKRYAGRLAVCAIVSEPFYDFAMGGTFWNLAAQNPVFSLLISLAMLCLLKQFRGTNIKAVLIKVLIVVGAVLWIVLLSCDGGIYLLALTLVFYFLHGDETWVILAGIGVTLRLFPAPLAFFLTHFHDGTRKVPEQKTRLLFYALYPLQLLAVGILGAVL